MLMYLLLAVINWNLLLSLYKVLSHILSFFEVMDIKLGITWFNYRLLLLLQTAMCESRIPLEVMDSKALGILSFPNTELSSIYGPKYCIPSTSPIPQTGRHTLTPPSNGTEALSPSRLLCSQCKGQKYGFSAYFHNTRIFLEPPHEILGLVERSYVLRDRLKSLLVTYAMRPVDQERVMEIEREINVWQEEIILLIKK